MHISLVSSTMESLSCVTLFHHLDEITVHEVRRLEELLDKNTPLDLVFFDATLGMKDIKQQIQLYQQKKHAITWMVMNVTDIQQSLQYLQSGASGILTQPNEKTLEDCFQTVFKGRLYLEADFIQILALRQIKKTLLPFKRLTAREYDVFCLLAEAYSIQTIAELLSVSAKTAFNCQAQLRKKLNIRNQQQILEMAKKHGLVNQ